MYVEEVHMGESNKENFSCSCSKGRAFKSVSQMSGHKRAESEQQVRCTSGACTITGIFQHVNVMLIRLFHSIQCEILHEGNWQI